MNRHIEKLKRDIAADNQSRDILEIQELAAQLEDLSRDLSFETMREVDPETMLEATMRSYWRAMILARKAIEKAEVSRQLANADTPLASSLAAA